MIGSWIGAVLAGLIGGLAWLGWRRGGMVAILVILALHALSQSHHVDDAGIVYAYAESLAHGHGLVPQPGAPVVEGISDPLWLILLLPAALVGADVGAAASVLQAGLMLATVFFAGRLAARSERAEAEPSKRPPPPPDETPADTTALAPYRPEPPRPEPPPPPRVRPVGIGPVRLAIATSGVVFAWTTAGLEGALLAFLLTVTAWASAARLGPVAAAGVFLCAWTRPEGAAAGLGVAVAGAALHGHWRTLLWPLGGALLGVGSLHGLRWAWLGTVVPTSALAKLGTPSWRFLLGGAVYAGLASLLSGWPVMALGWIRTPGPRRWLLPVGLTLATGLGLAVLSGGDWMRHGRFLAPYLPAVLAFGLPPLVRAWDRGLLPKIGLVGVLLVGWGVLVDAAWRPTVPVDHGLRRGRLYAAVATDACGAGDVSVATPDIGGVLWGWPQVRVLDLAGLVDQEAAIERLDPAYWPARLAEDLPALVDLHDRWAADTHLDAATLRGLGYRVLARREGRDPDDPTTPTLWLHARCEAPLSAGTQAMLDQWTAKGSGRAWELPEE